MARYSVAFRLTVFYTVGAMLAVGLLALLLSWKLSSSYQTEHLQYLQAKADEFQADLDDRGGQPQELVAEILKETADRPLRAYQARVLTDNRILGQTSGMDRTLPDDVFPPLVHGNMTPRQLRRHDAGAQDWLLVTLALHGNRDVVAPHVQLALDITRDDRLLTDFHRALAVFFLCLVPLLLIMGRWIADRALEPVRHIARYAGDITADHLSSRIPESIGWPKELDGLVRRLNAMLERLDDAFTRLSRFSADMAHELRTPLSNLAGELEVCLTRPRSADAYRATIESSFQECRFLIDLVENLLFLARADHAQMGVRQENFPAGEAAGWVVAQHAPGAAARQVRIDLEGSAKLRADPLLFRRALSNVLANAVRHAPDASTVRVQIHACADEGVDVLVIDQGAGVPPGDLLKVFERYFQVDPSRGRQAGQGTGLGLSIVYAILELHGGAASVTSRQGDNPGTTVRLRFPHRAASEPHGW